MPLYQVPALTCDMNGLVSAGLAVQQHSSKAEVATGHNAGLLAHHSLLPAHM